MFEGETLEPNDVECCGLPAEQPIAFVAATNGLMALNGGVLDCGVRAITCANASPSWTRAIRDTGQRAPPGDFSKRAGT
jgi:hypothetical protein